MADTWQGAQATAGDGGGDVTCGCHAQQGVLLNIVVGIVGAFIGGLIFSGGSINNAGLTLYSFLVSLAGAVILLAIVNLFRRGSVR